MWGPRSIAKLAHITPITMAFRTYNELVTGANLNQLITEGGPNCTSPFLFGLYHQLPVLFANLELDRAWLIPTFFCSLFVYLLHIAIYLLEIHSLLRFQSGVQSHIGYIYIYGYWVPKRLKHVFQRIDLWEKGARIPSCLRGVEGRSQLVSCHMFPEIVRNSKASSFKNTKNHPQTKLNPRMISRNPTGISREFMSFSKSENPNLWLPPSTSIENSISKGVFFEVRWVMLSIHPSIAWLWPFTSYNWF